MGIVKKNIIYNYMELVVINGLLELGCFVGELKSGQ